MTYDDTLDDAADYWRDVWRAEEHAATEAALREDGPPYPATRKEWAIDEGEPLPPRRNSTTARRFP